MKKAIKGIIKINIKVKIGSSVKVIITPPINKIGALTPNLCITQIVLCILLVSVVNLDIREFTPK